MGQMTDRDRKRLWGKSGGRCAHCRCPLLHPGQSGERETVVGQEAHIIGERPGAARYQPLFSAERDAYENRILLCPTHHVVVDGQPNHWTVAKLRALKDQHERTMTARTADARSDELQFHMPQAVLLRPVIAGRQLLNIVGPAYAYVFEPDDFEEQAEQDAAKALLAAAHDWGEIYSMISPSEQIDAVQNLGDRLRDAVQAGLLLTGELIDVDVTDARGRNRWPVAILRLRRAAVIAAEQAASREAEQALRDGGPDGLEAWAQATKRRSAPN